MDINMKDYLKIIYFRGMEKLYSLKVTIMKVGLIILNYMDMVNIFT
jgi:hypothetical protein